MPVFEWYDGSVSHNFSCNMREPGEVIYRLLRNLPRDYKVIIPNKFTLRMFSTLENRWVDVYSLPTVMDSWPYIEVEQLFDMRFKLHGEILRNAHGHSSMNPCGEIVLGQLEEDSLTKYYAEM